MRGMFRLCRPIVRFGRMQYLISHLVRGMLISALLVIGSCPELLEMFPHRHLGVVAAGHDATPLEALEHLVGIETDSEHDHARGNGPAGVSLVSPSHGSLLGLDILIPVWFTLLLTIVLIAKLAHVIRESFDGCTWPPLSPPPQTTVSLPRT